MYQMSIDRFDKPTYYNSVIIWYETMCLHFLKYEAILHCSISVRRANVFHVWSIKKGLLFNKMIIYLFSLSVWMIKAQGYISRFDKTGLNNPD